MKKQYFYIILLAAIYFITAKVGLLFAFENTNATAVWAPSGIALAVLLLSGNKYWPAIFIGAFAANFQILYAEGLPINSVLLITFFTAIGNTLEALVGAFLIRHFTKSNTALNTFNGILLFIFLGAFISTLISASVGSISYGLFTNNWTVFSGMLKNWWLGDALGVLTIAPVVLFWKQKKFDSWKVNKYLELIVFIAVIALFVYFISETNYPLKFLLIPILLWSVFRFGKLETFVFILLVSFSALFLNASAYIAGPTGPSRSILIFQLYFGAIAITFLILSAVLSESEEAKKSRKESEACLKEAQRIAKVGNWELNLITNKLFWSDEVYRIFNLEPRRFEVTYEAFLDHIHPEDRDSVNKAYTESIKNKRPYSIEHRLLLENGKIKYVKEHGETFYDDSGKPIRSFGTVQDMTQIKKVSIELENSKNYIQTIFDSTSDAIFLHDAKSGAILDVNRQTCEMFGFDKKEILFGSVQPMSMGQSPYSEKEAFEWLSKSKTEGKQTFEWRGKHKDGHLFWVEVSIVFVQLGEENRYIASARNIENRKNAEKQKNELLQRFENINNHLPGAVYQFCLRPDGSMFVPYASKGIEELYGAKEEIIKKDASALFNVVHPDDLEKASNSINESAANLSPWHSINRHLFPDGRMIWVEGNSTPEKLEDGSIMWHGYIRDVTQRMQSEKMLQEKEAFNRTLLNTSPDLIYIYDIIERKNVYSNQGIMKILGYSVEDVQIMGENVLPNLMHPDDFKSYLKEIIPLYQTTLDEQIIEHDYRMKHKDGTWRWLSSKETIFMRQEDGSPKQIFGLTSDITERKEQAEEIKRINSSLEKRIEERTQELEKKNKILEKMNKVFVGRENRMAELKKEIEQLRKG